MAPARTAKLLVPKKRSPEANSEAFQYKEQLLEAFFSTSAVGLAICDLQHRYVAVNEALAVMNGFPAEEHLGRTLRDILGDGAVPVEQAFDRIVVTGKPLLNLELALKLPTRNRIGHWIENYFPMKDATGKVQQIGAIVVEVTKQKQAEEERKKAETGIEKLSELLLNIQGEERRRIARDLHDSTAQQLAALKMSLGAIKNSGGPGQKGVLGDCLELVETCLQDIRTFAHMLHPPLLEEFGLWSALRRYVVDVGKRSGLRLRLDIDRSFGEERLPAHIETALFRIVQESLTNVLLHSRSKTAAIELRRRYRPRQVVLTVKDAGNGMPERVLRAIETGDGTVLGMGISGMRERVTQLGGRVRVETSGRGTMLSFLLPLPKPGNAPIPCIRPRKKELRAG